MTDSSSMLRVDARWVVPMSSRIPLLEQHTVLIKDGLVFDLLPTEQAQTQYSNIKTLVLNQHVLIPGLINLHTHAAMSLMRGLADDLPLMTWLQDHIWPAEKKWVSERFVRDGTLLACAEMLKGGTTCFNDMYFYPSSIADASLQAGMRASIGLVVIDFPTNYANDADDYLLKGLEFRDQYRDHALVSTSLAPHAPYTVSNTTFEKVVTYAEQLNIGIHTHLHETAVECQESIKQYGVRPLARLAQLGVLGPNLVAAHCVHLDDHDIALLAEYQCHVAHCPTSNLKLASGIAPVTHLIKAGVNVAVGTDGAASNNRLDMFAEMRMAALLAKGASGDPASVPAYQALSMATIQAASALGIDDKIGSIDIGKCADLVAVKLQDVETTPCFDPISHLIYAAGREHVTHVWVQGDLRYQKLDGQNGVYANIEPQELQEISTLWQSKLMTT